MNIEKNQRHAPILTNLYHMQHYVTFLVNELALSKKTAELRGSRKKQHSFEKDNTVAFACNQLLSLLQNHFVLLQQYFLR